ncbi:MAG TPA: hypothetical protein VFJ91_09175 [Gaiellaceae bacterium]|nr:hypothetical protein [Gaiellaceae bacterium]
MRLRLAALALLLLALAAGASGCGLRLRAVQLKVDVSDGSMRLIEPTSGRYAGGEVVITIVNNTDQRRQFTLAETDAAPKAIPHGVLDAYSDRDDSRVVAVSGVMRPASVELAFGALPQPQPTETKLHVFLHPGKRYLLFDRLGGYRHGLALPLRARSG